jgi:hypothetical protein
MKPVVIVVGAAAVAAFVLLIASSRKRGCVDCPKAPESKPPANHDDVMRAAAVDAARSEFERVNASGAPNANPADYWALAAKQKLSPAELKKLDWCGGFYLWALKVAFIAPPTLFWNFNGTGIADAHLKRTNDPKPADLAYFTRNQHHALIESVDGDTIHLINGNGGGKGITRSAVSRKQVAGFFSIEPLLQHVPGDGLNA